MTRREMLAVLAAASAQRASAQTALKFRGLDHIEFTVKDVEKSTNFYAQLFGGADVMKNRTTTRRYIKLGSSYMAIDKADSPKIDHVCLGIENFNIEEVHALLTAKGLTYRDYPSGRDTGVNDPDGTRLQLSSAGGWTSLAAQTASPEPRDIQGLFRPVDLHVVEINVRDLLVSAPHYAKMLGPFRGTDIEVGNGRLDLFTGDPGFRRFRIQVEEKFDAEEMTRKVMAFGATEDKTKGVGLRFLDPDGFRVEVQPLQPSEKVVA